jgi:prolyl-tRNA synthetase
VRRDNSAKIDIPMDNLVEQVRDLLDNIQKSLFDVAKQKKEACIQVVKTWEEFVEALGQKKLILAPWCDEEVCLCDSLLLHVYCCFCLHGFHVAD